MGTGVRGTRKSEIEVTLPISGAPSLHFTILTLILPTLHFICLRLIYPIGARVQWKLSPTMSQFPNSLQRKAKKPIWANGLTPLGLMPTPSPANHGGGQKEPKGMWEEHGWAWIMWLASLIYESLHTEWPELPHALLITFTLCSSNLIYVSLPL